jgi:thiol-disulfide isomerase/thioredoxin
VFAFLSGLLVMKKLIFIFFLTLPFVSISQTVEVVNFDELEKAAFTPDKDTLKVINFWATWCGPCIKELPAFKAVSDKYPGVNFVYVSLDFTTNLERVKKMINAKGLKGDYYVLTGDQNVWINKIDENWQGDIPYTFLITQKGEKIKEPKTFESEEELEELIKKGLGKK